MIDFVDLDWNCAVPSSAFFGKVEILLIIGAVFGFIVQLKKNNLVTTPGCPEPGL